MAVCKLCEKVIGFGEGSNKVLDGVICDECLAKRVLGGVRVQDLYKYSNKIKEIEKLTAAEVDNLFEKKKAAESEAKNRMESAESKSSSIIVTTTDLKKDYEILSPVYIQINNRSNQFYELREKYEKLIKELQENGQRSNDKIGGLGLMDVLLLDGGASYNGHADFDTAFFIAVEELKIRAAMIGADAVIGMRQDIDLDSDGYQFFYLQMYGTAVKFI